MPVDDPATAEVQFVRFTTGGRLGLGVSGAWERISPDHAPNGQAVTELAFEVGPLLLSRQVQPLERPILPRRRVTRYPRARP